MLNGDINPAWRECVKWLVRIKLIPYDHYLMESTARLSDLAYFLKDGVALCIIANILKPGCLDVDKRQFISKLKPFDSQFLSTGNVRTFLLTCTNCFKIPSSHLFSPEKVFKMENIGEVLHFLSVLSKKSEEFTNIKSFSLNKSDYAHFDCDGRVDARVIDYVTMERDVYGRLVEVDRKQMKLTNLNNGVNSEKTALESCREELMSTESSYISKLQLIQDKFINVLRSSMPSDYFEKIFFCISKLLDIHKTFENDLKKTFMEDSARDVADVFIMFKEDFIIYGDYCRNLTHAQVALDELSNRDEVFFRLLKECESKTDNNKFRLTDHLSVPMQRILKYPLLLKELVRLSPAHKQKTLQVALQEIQDLAMYVNEVNKDYEIITTIENIQESIKGLPNNINMKRLGRILKDSLVKYKSSSDNLMKKRYFFLFDKALIICRHNRSGAHEFEMKLNVENLNFEVVKKDTTIFKLSCSEPAITLMVNCKKRNLVEDWLDALKTAKENLNPHGSCTSANNFILSTFDDVRICDACKKLLRGVFFQGYYCTKTGLVVHRGCMDRCQTLNNPTLRPMKSNRPLSSGSIDQSKSSSSANSLDCPRYYINSSIISQLWYVGEMTRELAYKVLHIFPEGTFLVRNSQKGTDDYSLNLKYNGEVHNIKIKTKDNEYSFAPSRKFQSLIDLITYYSKNSLESMFSSLKTTLEHPIKGVEPICFMCICISMGDVERPSNSEWLSLKGEDRIYVISKCSADEWIGYSNCKIGKFEIKNVKIY